MESKNCKDQIFLLLYEPHYAETLYCLLVERDFTMDLKQKVLKVMTVPARIVCYIYMSNVSWRRTFC